MMPTTIDRVLACPTLPSLPAVAVEVLALTREQNVSLMAISKVVQNDPGLAAKILKTVNSSFYGLQQPCSRLDRAMSYLGLQAVKSLVLGFSLVDATRGLGDAQQIDLRRHWRRTIFAASAARHLAQTTRAADADEVFTCALFQDIGVLACVAALGAEYAPTMATAPEDHDLLCRHEREVFPFDHTTVGSELARKWKLPDVYVEAIRKHHNPESSGLDRPEMVRLTALSMYIAEALSTPGAQSIVARLGTKGQAWFGLTPDRMAALLKSTATSATELAKLFEQDVAIPNASVIMAEAQEALVNGHIEVQREADRLKIENCTDTLTGAWNRRKFDTSLAEEFLRAKSERRSLSVLFIDADKFKSVNDSYGHAAGDAVLKELARRGRATVGDGGLLCRYGGEEFAVILPGMDGVRAKETAEALRRAMCDRHFDLNGVDGAPPSIPVTISLGVATMEAGSGNTFETPEQMTALADQGVYSAKSSGRNCVRAASPAARIGEVPAVVAAPIAVAPVAAVATTVAPPRAGPGVRAADSSGALEMARAMRSSDGVLRILVVDDDPLAGKLLSMIFQRLPQSDVRVANTGASAIDLVRGAAAFRPALAIVDQCLPDTKGVEVVRTLRAECPTLRKVVVITATPTPGLDVACREAGADALVLKLEMCNDVGRWIISLLSGAARAAA